MWPAAGSITAAAMRAAMTGSILSMWEKAQMCAMKKSTMERAKEPEAKVLNPVTKIYMEEDSVFTLDTAQIKGVDSTLRETDVHLGAGAKLYVLEKLMTHDQQTAESNMEVDLDGEGSSAQIISPVCCQRNFKTDLSSQGCGQCEMPRPCTV